jgi:hypothetical protein
MFFAPTSTLIARLILSLGSITLGAHSMDLQTLVDRSPFAPPGGVPVVNETSAQPSNLEFRGLVIDASGTSFSVFDIGANRGYWLRTSSNDPKHPIVIQNYNAAENQLAVIHNGNAVKLQLKAATTQNGPPIAINTAGQVPKPPGGQNELRRGPESGSDPRRLEAVAAEVRRRRALRNAAKTTPPPVAGQPPTSTTAPATQ